MASTTVCKRKCVNRKCRASLKDNERGYCDKCKEIIAKTMKTAKAEGDNNAR